MVDIEFGYHQQKPNPIIMKLSLHTQPEVPLEAEVITTKELYDKNEVEISRLSLFHGNQKVPLGEFFKVTGKFENSVEIEGDLSRVKLIGCGMSSGKLIVDGNVGTHLGAGMTGGEIMVTGDGGDWVGREMSGGRILIKGNAGHMVGSAIRGSSVGILGGEIIIHGNIKNEAGSAMRRGMIAVGGNSGDFTGVNMLAGTVLVLGQMGIRNGAGMKRGSIITMQNTEMLPTFNYACTYQPSFLPFYFNHLRQLGLAIKDSFLDGVYQRWTGDSIELNRGEILILQP